MGNCSHEPSAPTARALCYLHLQGRTGQRQEHWASSAESGISRLPPAGQVPETPWALGLRGRSFEHRHLQSLSTSKTYRSPLGLVGQRLRVFLFEFSPKENTSTQTTTSLATPG